MDESRKKRISEALETIKTLQATDTIREEFGPLSNYQEASDTGVLPIN